MGADQSPSHRHTVQRVRIFLASSAELAEHRREFALFINDQNKLLIQRGVFLELVQWEDFLDAMSATRLQDEYNKALQQCELFVMLFRTKVGRYTAEEFEKAFGQFQQTGRPLIWTYFNDAPVTTGQVNRADMNSLWDFQDKLKTLGHFQTVYDHHDTLCRHFGEQLDKLESEGFFDPPPEPVEPESDTTTWLHDPLTPDQQTLLDALLAEPDDPPAPDATRLQLAERVLQAPVGGLRGYLLRRYAQWCSTEGGRLDRRFVSLTLLVNHGREADGEQFTLQGDRGRFDRLQDLLAEHQDVQGWVLVGEPGSGKSTLLQHHELHTTRTALRALAATPDGTPATTQPEVCIWQRLSHYDAGEALRSGQRPADWLQEQWQLQWQAGSRTPLPPLTELQRHVRLRWVLDGLNEIRYASEAEFDAAVQGWRDWAAAWCTPQALPPLAPLFSVRTREQADLGMAVRRIDIEPWSTEQVHQYCRRRAGIAPDDTTSADPPLWQALSAPGRQDDLEMCRLPFNLAAQCVLYAHLKRPARHRAELISGLVWLGLVRDLDKPHLRAPGLLSRHDRQRLQGVRDRGWSNDNELMCLPVEGRLLPWLDMQAEQMHRQGRTEGRAVAEPEGVVLQRLPAEPRPPEPAQWLAALQLLGWWDHSGTDRRTGRPLLRFTHQLWQEFFAARSLCDLLEQRPAELPDLSPPALDDLEQAMRGLGPQMPLRPPRINHWEEAVRLLLQFGHQDHAAWLEAIRPVNLPLAGRVAAGCRTELQATPAGCTLLQTLRTDLLTRSRDPAVDVRQRIEAGLVLGELGDPRWEERQGPHGRYLWPKQWVQVPGGVYRIGDDNAPYNDEKPETKVTISPFEMAFAPVTNAEYRCFIEAGGYQDEQWWEGETARRWLKEGVRNEAEIERVGALFVELRTALAEGRIEDLLQQYNLTKAQQEQWRDTAAQSPEEHERTLDDWYGARRFELPQEWSNPQFNAPTQPVVGICQFEAKAYARWLQAQSGRQVRLPSEAEWEAAARGREGRRWPWGEEAPERWQMNADPAHLRRTSPVGAFPGADTPQGLTDLSGNVWEWTSSLYTDRLDAAGFNEEGPDDLARRVVRGGSWYLSIVGCRASYRRWFAPDDRSLSLGFRLVVSCPIQGTEP